MQRYLIFGSEKGVVICSRAGEGDMTTKELGINNMVGICYSLTLQCLNSDKSILTRTIFMMRTHTTDKYTARKCMLKKLSRCTIIFGDLFLHRIDSKFDDCWLIL